MSYRRKKFQYKRTVEYICNYIDSEWLDAIGTDGTRLSIPSKLVQSEIYPDDVLSITVKRDKIKSERRHQGGFFCPVIEAPVFCEGTRYPVHHGGKQLRGYPAKQSKSKIVAFPKPEAPPKEHNRSTLCRRKKAGRHKRWILRRRVH